MAINAALLKELRERTGAGIVDCKKALDENGGDVEKACVWLREKGIAKAVKKASRVAAEGTFAWVVEGNNCLVYEVNCETDFVASNAKFKTFVEELGKELMAAGAKCTDCAMKATTSNGETVEQMLRSFIAIIGENITLRNVKVITKADNEQFGIYRHFDGKTLVVVTMEGGDADVAKKVAMHACASKPQYLDQAGVDQEYIAKEREIISAEVAQDEKNAKKPAEILAKMIDGRIAKELKAICLVDQPFVIDPNTTVGQYLASNKATVKAFSINIVGEGIQKKENNFVEEVMAQAQGK